MKITHVVQDTREKRGKHRNIEEYLRQSGVKIIRDKVYVGDYTLPTDRRVSIDIKQDVVEIAGNICGAEHARFREELRRAQETGTQLYVLIQQNECSGKSIACPEDLRHWEAPKFRYGAKRGEPLGKAMRTMESRYGVIFLFCAPEEAGQYVLELLGEKK